MQEAGIIDDDELNDRLVKPIKPGCILHALVDSCHSETVLDLEFVAQTPFRECDWRNEGSKCVVVLLRMCPAACLLVMQLHVGSTLANGAWSVESRHAVFMLMAAMHCTRRNHDDCISCALRELSRASPDACAARLTAHCRRAEYTKARLAGSRCTSRHAKTGRLLRRA